MLVRMRGDASPSQIENVQTVLNGDGRTTRIVDRTIVVLTERKDDESQLRSLPGVASVENLDTPYKLVHRAVRPEGTRIQVGGVQIGAREFVVAAGPCAVESEPQLRNTAEAVSAAGARILRGGAFKPRTSPYSFRGLEEEGLRVLSQVGRSTDMPVVTEVLTAEDVPEVAAHADILQIGARNMQNYLLLEAAGASGKPVLLKRGLSATVEELLLAAEYIALQGNLNIILCERGIRTFEPATRNTLDLASATLLRQRTHLPVFVDPSHATGRRELVEPLSKAAAALGIAGLIIEVHPDPDSALCDGAQSLTPNQFEELMDELSLILMSQGRSLGMRADGPFAPRQIELLLARIDGIDATLSRRIGERFTTVLAGTPKARHAFAGAGKRPVKTSGR